MSEFYVPKYKSVVLHVEGERVQIIHQGTLLLELPWKQAKELARAIRHQSAVAEQNEKIAQVISDQAFMIRAGVPIALTSRADVFKEAGKEAAHDRELRRAMPGGLPSGVKFGVPCLRDLRPGRPGRIGAIGVSTSELFGKIGGR